MKQLGIQVNSLRPLQGTGRKLFVETYGCQMNVGDSEIVVSLMQREGYVYTDRIEQADVISSTPARFATTPNSASGGV